MVNDEEILDKLGKKEMYINMTGNKNGDNKDKIDTDIDHFQLPIEGTLVLATPTHDNNNSDAPSSSVKYTSFMHPSSSPVTDQAAWLFFHQRLTLLLLV